MNQRKRLKQFMAKYYVIYKRKRARANAKMLYFGLLYGMPLSKLSLTETPTLSSGIFEQKLGRALRPKIKPLFRVIELDYANNAHL